MAPAFARALWAQPRDARRVVAEEPFGRLEQVADGVWALISTPLTGDRTTLSNGGIIAGTTGVMAVEGFMMPEGARWLATKARELTGRWPTHAVVTHYHADHVGGVAGYRDPGTATRLLVTEETRGAVLGAKVAQPTPADDARREALQASVAPDDWPGGIDLGGRRVRVVRRKGHTASDVTIEVNDPAVTFTGDLVWNGMFPNYVDALPSALAASTRALRRSGAVAYVPGHGPVAREQDMDRYLDVLAEVERAARAAHTRGAPAAEAAGAFTLPASLGEWYLFNKVFFERAFTAWYRELGGGAGGDDAR
jgi:glyoxylase-like metal-dependent hydrolase (beta-lactamase superfamily II)